ncbi:hypothetical protein [Tsukamurella pseudospumae]|uniref:Uncharacterized protein n=2 Tax=Tsukamurella pseudospumae TaxID=239498 RepID=A0A137ZIH7_9ACTN|nr:hypothetical protein [Tsukamurella pseudospumae]KXO97991.1 hypothetical protein AXK61_20725 [Tsukamurella pseudospumae]
MTEFRTAGGWLLLTDGAVEIHRGGRTVTVPLGDVEDIRITAGFVHVQRVGAPATSAADLSGDPTMISIAPEQWPAAVAFRDAAFKARRAPQGDPSPVLRPPSTAVDDTLTRPAAARPNYGAASRERPDIKAAMYWFRQLDPLPSADQWLVDAVGDDELVLGAFEVWRVKDEGWQPLLVTDRRLLYATATPTPTILELPLSVLIRITQGESNDAGHVQVNLVDRTGQYKVWLRSNSAYHRFYLTTNNARSFSIYAVAPAPEPLRGNEVAEQYRAYSALMTQIDAGTVPEAEVGARVAAIFGVAPPEQSPRRDWE